MQTDFSNYKLANVTRSLVGAVSLISPPVQVNNLAKTAFTDEERIQTHVQHNLAVIILNGNLHVCVCVCDPQLTGKQEQHIRQNFKTLRPRTIDSIIQI